MKLRKGNLAMVLSFMLMFSLFFATTIAFLYNNKADERRSSFVDYINKLAMDAQADLEGFSYNNEYCFMYESGTILSQEQALAKANAIKQRTLDQINLAFKELPENATRNHDGSMTAKDGTTIPANVPLLSQIFTLNSVTVDIVESNPNSRLSKVTLQIKVKYTASLRAPFADGETNEDTGEIILADKGSTAGRFKVVHNDSAKRSIENPRRYKGISKN